MTIDKTMETVAEDATLGSMEPADIVVITTRDGTEIKGILREQFADAFILTSAAIAGEGPNQETVWKDLVGEVVVPASRVEYYQRALPAEILSKL